MKRVPLDSTAIAAVTYEEQNRALDVEFREGETYRYFNVPEFWNSVMDQYEFVLQET